MQTRSWIPEKKDYNFIHQNITIMSPQEMADCFKVSIGILNREKTEMGLIIDDYMEDSVSTAEYELDRWLNRKVLASQWEFKYKC